MPFIPIESKIKDIKIGLWRIEEEEEYFYQRLNLYENETNHLAKLSHPQKKIEWLSSRLCLKTLLNITEKVESLKNEEGKPYLSNHSYYISYSHSSNYSSAIASKENYVAIDIEFFRKSRSPELSKMFMNQWELSYYKKTGNPYLFFLIWSAKETLFKIHSKRGIYFRENIHINLEDFSLNQNGKLLGIVQCNGIERYYDVYYEIFSDFVLTYTSQRLQQSQKSSIGGGSGSTAYR